jgi:NTE family protein
VGLVLSGGGAKGFAHIGILQMLDSLRIPVDYIAGTSIGGIGGALYSIGYSGDDLETLMTDMDWDEIFTDTPPREQLPYFQKKDAGRYQLEFGLEGVKPVPPSGLIFGQKISLLFSSLTFPYEQVDSFDELPIPFRCVAVDLITGNEVILKDGSLAKAMRATMAIPTVFSAVEWGDSLLVDGGMLNNLPVDVVRSMGADVVIAVDVESPLKPREKIRSVLDVLNQTLSLLGLEKKKENLQFVDLLIKPDIGRFTVGDFDEGKVSQIVETGKITAKRYLPELIALRDKYRLDYSENLNGKRILDIQISGHTTLPFDTLYKHLQVSEGMIYSENVLEAGIDGLKERYQFIDIVYDVVPVSGNDVRVMVQLEESQKPIINGIYISDNRNLSFTFIYRLLGVEPGMRLDTDELNARIMNVYSLGYFEKIEYDIEPHDASTVDLYITVKELPLRKLRVGLRYDDLHKIVAAVSAQATNLFVQGMRLESELQFAGLRHFQARAFYPSRALHTPIYPFIQFSAKDIPTDIFDIQGRRIANYKDRSASFGIGVGFLLSKYLNAEVSYRNEYLNVKPGIAFDDPDIFPVWKNILRKVNANLNIDRLDDVLLPRSGFVMNMNYEGSLDQLKSETPFQVTNAYVDAYFTLKRKHTIRLYGFGGKGSSNIPVYKYMNQGRPGTFVGMNYDQLVGGSLAVLRGEYRFQYKKDIFFKLIGNIAPIIDYPLAIETSRVKNIRGVGLGVKLLSLAGPLELIVSRGDRNFSRPRKGQLVVYFTMGYKF